jgi:3-dehydroquinate dehydratase/shikimate dehydrogenase
MVNILLPALLASLDDAAAPPVRVCVPVCVRRASELPEAVERASQVADMVEVRLDCLDAEELGAARAQLGALLAARTRPFILTLRPAPEGGRRALDDDERRRFRRRLTFEHEGRTHAPDFADIELNFGDERQIDEVSKTCGVILSHHDFAGVPADLEQLYERMAETRAHIIKIAVLARDAVDCLPVVRLLERARREGRALIAVAMGEGGLWTRVMSPAHGSFLTYAALDREQATAPGQLTADALVGLYRVRSITSRTQVTGLVGSPVSHSLSPHMHNAAFAAQARDAVYLPFEVRDAGAFLRRMVSPRTRELKWNVRGLSVTAPHKSAVLAHLDWVEPKARKIGAVNTVVVEEWGELRGYNTDADASLAPLEGIVEFKGARVAVLGAGGAARALLWALARRGAEATVYARKLESAREVCDEFGARAASLAGASFSGFDAIVNATPLGTRGRLEGETPAHAAQLAGARVVYDLVYNPRITRFMREGREAGCRAVGGLAMLVAQAAAQYKLWTGEDAPLEVMREAAERVLAAD